MTDDRGTTAATTDEPTAAPAPSATFRAVPTVALVAVGFLALCLSPIAFQGGPWFLLFLVPLAVGVWVVRSRTRVDEEGLHVHRVVGTRSVAWAELSGLRLPEKGWVRAVRTEGAEVQLRGVRIRDLGRIAQASGNRISAPTPAEAEAAAEHARELEAARMRVARLRERQAAEHPDDTAADAEATDNGTTDATTDADEAGAAATEDTDAGPGTTDTGDAPQDAEPGRRDA